VTYSQEIISIVRDDWVFDSIAEFRKRETKTYTPTEDPETQALEETPKKSKRKRNNEQKDNKDNNTTTDAGMVNLFLFILNGCN